MSITWNSSATSVPLNQVLGLAYGNNLYVGVGQNNTLDSSGVIYSSNGTSWTAVNVSNPCYWKGITYANGYFVAVGIYSSITKTIITSTNGTSWTSVTGISNNLYSVAYGNSAFVAVGNSSLLRSTDNGATWSSRTIPSGANANWQYVTFGNNLFVAVSNDGGANGLITSPDGITWTLRTIPSPYYGWFSVAYGNGKYVVVTGSTNSVLVSSNGTSWALQSVPASSNNYYSIIYVNNAFVIGGFASVITSSNTTSWSQQSITNNVWQAIGSNNTTTVLLGSAAGILIGALPITQAVITVASSFNKTFRDPSFNLSATTTNNQTPIVYTSGNVSVATVDTSGNVTIGNVGSSIITLSQGQTAGYLAVSANTTINVARLQANITVSSTFNKTYGDPSFNLSATTTNNQTPIVYTSGNVTIATVDTSGNVTIGNVGNTIITLSQAQTSNYLAVSANANINVSRLQANITVSSTFNKTYGDPSFNLTATTNNTQTPIVYTSGNVSIATVDTSGNVSIISGGNTIITLSQAQTSGYLAVSANANINVSRLQSNITVASTFNKIYGDPSFNLTATTNNTQTPIVYTSGNVSVATVDTSGNVFIISGGNTTISLSQSQTSGYLAVSANANINVSRITSNITVASTFTKTYGDASFNLSATTNNTQTPIVYTSGNVSIVSVDASGNVIIGNVGNTTISLSQSQTSGYTDISANTSISVIKSTPNITVNSAFVKTYGDASFNLNATSNNSETSIVYTSQNTSVATVNSAGVVTPLSIGYTIITLSQSATSNFLDVSATTTVIVKNEQSSVNSSLQVINQLSSTNAVHYNGSYYLIGGNAVINSSDGTTWSSSSTPISNMSTITNFAWNHPDKGCPVIKPMTIACGEGNNTLAYSLDGIYWKGLGKTVLTTRANKAIWNGVLWVAVGAGNFWVATSYDGINWLGRDTQYLNEAYDIAWNGQVFVAVGVGNNANMAMSFDGVVWNPIPDSNVFFSVCASAVIWTGKCWLAYGSGTNTSMICANPDGWRWSPTTPANLVISEMVSGINSIGYTDVSASSVQTFPATNAFDNSLNTTSSTEWRSALSTYNATTGAYTGSISTTYNTTLSVSGEWLELKMNYPMVIQSYHLAWFIDSSTNSFTIPKSWKLVGSIDKTDWTLIDTFDYGVSTPPTNTSANPILIQLRNTFPNTMNVRWYRVIVTSIFPGGSLTYARISEMDFYAANSNTLTIDRNIKPILTKTHVLHPTTIIPFSASMGKQTVYNMTDLDCNLISNNTINNGSYNTNIINGLGTNIITSTCFDGENLIATPKTGNICYISNDNLNTNLNFDISLNGSPITKNITGNIYTSCFNGQRILLGGEGGNVITYSTTLNNSPDGVFKSAINANNLMTKVNGLASNSGYGFVYVPNRIYMNPGDKVSVVAPKSYNKNLSGTNTISMNLNNAVIVKNVYLPS